MLLVYCHVTYFPVFSTFLGKKSLVKVAELNRVACRGAYNMLNVSLEYICDKYFDRVIIEFIVLLKS